MGKINILTQQVANKIAAGEVVEKPASVVKELVENSIDANAKYITIEIKNGGISYIRVTDDGIGIMKDDVLTAFERHATSKIYTESDLELINTLGFRGEALASIAAVSQTELITKSKDEEVGSLVVIKGGELVENKEIGCPEGTTITVKNLFFNTPARMKFLKKDKSEAGYINDIINRLILAHPEVSFKYINNGKEMVYTSGDNNLKNCVHEIYGKDYAKNMISVNYEANGIKITGLIGNSTLSRSNRTFQSFFVNGRYVKSSVFSYSLQEGYKNSIMINRFPVAVLQLYLNPSLIDVNVHPTKMEVKFSNDKQIFDAIYWSVKNALYIKRDIPEINITKKSYEYIPSKKEFESITIADKSIKEPYIHPEMREKYISQFNQQEFVLDSNENNKKIDKSVDISYIIEDNIEFKIIGQLFSTYIIIEKDGDMMLIDQHAAHERLIYEKILEKHKKSEIYPQRLISPVVMVLSPSELDIFNSSYEILSKLGFEGEEFGNNSIIVRQSPINVGEEAIRKIVFDIIELIKLNNFNFTTELEEKILYNVACKSAVKGNKKLSFEEMESLVKKVLSLKNINTCPHGRPIIISISKSKIEKEFKRAGI